ncbi:MAG TPA: hypothetical protein VGN52_23695 [Burkholderiales bacterium]|jgi:hypothetical protein
MKTIKLLAATAALIAAASAFAGTDDGNVPPYPTERILGQAPTPAPTASTGESGKAASGDTGMNDFLRQLQATSGN